MNSAIAVRKFLAAALVLGVCVAPESVAADPVLELPAEDRKALEKGLGKGVIGKAVPAPTIEDPAEFVNVEPRTYKYRVTFGDKKGELEEHVLSKLKGDAQGDSWKLARDSKHARYLTTLKDGSFELVSDEDGEQGVITRYSPAQPLWKSHWKPGDVTKLKIDVKVYELADPKEVSHSGYFNVIYKYVGAYEVNVPAGKFEACLLKWTYEGKIGPAKIQDVRYSLLAKGIGPVAGIEALDVSALFVYQDHEKVGRVLVEASQ